MHSRIRGIGMTSQRTRERLVQRLKEKGIKDAAVLEVIRNTPRHLFVDEALASRAYEDTALPIGFQQTISQPWVVAKMTELLIENGIPQKVLEVGTGSGYQTAVLASLVPRVYSVERISELASQARLIIRKLGFRNVRIQHTDGTEGWDRYGPYDGILVTAAPAEIPQALLEQLADGGRLVMPLGDRHSQRLVVVTRKGQTCERSDRDPVIFVPLKTGAV